MGCPKHVALLLHSFLQYRHYLGDFPSFLSEMVGGEVYGALDDLGDFYFTTDKFPNNKYIICLNKMK